MRTAAGKGAHHCTRCGLSRAIDARIPRRRQSRSRSSHRSAVPRASPLRALALAVLHGPSAATWRASGRPRRTQCQSGSRPYAISQRHLAPTRELRHNQRKWKCSRHSYSCPAAAAVPRWSCRANAPTAAASDMLRFPRGSNSTQNGCPCQGPRFKSFRIFSDGNGLGLLQRPDGLERPAANGRGFCCWEPFLLALGPRVRRRCRDPLFAGIISASQLLLVSVARGVHHSSTSSAFGRIHTCGAIHLKATGRTAGKLSTLFESVRCLCLRMPYLTDSYASQVLPTSIGSMSDLVMVIARFGGVNHERAIDAFYGADVVLAAKVNSNQLGFASAHWTCACTR